VSQTRAKPTLFNIGGPRQSCFNPDGTVDLNEKIGQEFDEVLDPLNDMLTGRNKSLPASRHGTAADADPIQTARERQSIERDLNEFQTNMARVLSDMLAPQRIKVEGVTRDRECAFTVFAINRGDGQRLTASISIDDALRSTELRNGRDDFTRLCRQVAEKVLAARERALS
jgi:hypothetical protein